MVPTLRMVGCLFLFVLVVSLDGVLGLSEPRFKPFGVELDATGCPQEPEGAIVPRNSPRLLFIGAHHTGTTSYIQALKAMIGKIPLVHPGHEFSWCYDFRKLYKHDSLADVSYRHVAEWEPSLEFGSHRHPPVRMLHRCFPKSLFVINTRPLVDYLRSKLSWESGRSKKGIPSDPCNATNVTGKPNMGLLPSDHRGKVSNPRFYAIVDQDCSRSLACQ